MNKALQDALWAGDLDKLQELAPCDCCCDEHFFEHCMARTWGGCRGQHSLTRTDYEAWAKHYGMSMNQFLSGDLNDELPFDKD